VVVDNEFSEEVPNNRKSESFIEIDDRNSPQRRWVWALIAPSDTRGLNAGWRDTEVG
jgi:hypothetical protein